jgi:hypothetical protein
VISSQVDPQIATVTTTIRPSRDFQGLCEFRKGVFRPSEDWLEREILIALVIGLVVGLIIVAGDNGNGAPEARSAFHVFTEGLHREGMPAEPGTTDPRNALDFVRATSSWMSTVCP